MSINTGATLHEETNVVTSVIPDAHAVGTVNGVAVPTAGYRRAMAVLTAGTIGTGGTLDTKIQYQDPSDDSWNDLLGEDGTTVIAFDQLDENSGATTKVGEIPLTEIPEHSNLRGVSAVAGAAADHSLMFILGDPYDLPTTQVNVFEDDIGIGART